VRLKDELRALLQSGDEVRLAAMVADDPRSVRHVVTRLWDGDNEVRDRAARALGEAAVHHPGLIREVVWRLMWALNDESATRGGPGLVGLGEIGRRAPEILAPYVPALAAMAGDEGLRAELLQALGALAASAPELVAPHVGTLERAIGEPGPDARAALASLRNALGGRGHEQGIGG
jgi:hypothetical protein